MHLYYPTINVVTVLKTTMELPFSLQTLIALLFLSQMTLATPVPVASTGKQLLIIMSNPKVLTH